MPGGLDDDRVAGLQCVGGPQVAGRAVSRVRAVAFPAGHGRVPVVAYPLVGEHVRAGAFLDGAFPVVAEPGYPHPADDGAVAGFGFGRRVAAPGFGDPGRVARIHVLDAVADGEGLLRVDAVERVPPPYPADVERAQDGEREAQPGHELEDAASRAGAWARVPAGQRSPSSPWRPRVCVTASRMTRSAYPGASGKGNMAL